MFVFFCDLNREEYFNKFGELEEAFYVHSDHLHYTKSCTVKMGTVSSVSQVCFHFQIYNDHIELIFLLESDSKSC